MKPPQKHALAAFVSVAIIGLATSTIAAESAQATAGLLKMEINTTCSDGNAFFRIKNAGEAWPKTSTFAIYHMRKKNNKRVRKLISKRRMRLKDGQRASFKINTSKFPYGQLGLWIKPGWYKRDFGYDATVTCG